MRHRAWLLALILMASLGFTSNARADGGLFLEGEEVGREQQSEVVGDGRLSSNLQRALFVSADEACWNLYVQPGSMAVAGAAWILPLPVVPVEIAEDADRSLDQVAAATRPVVTTRTRTFVQHWVDHGQPGWCGGSAESGGDGLVSDPVGDPSESTQTAADAVSVVRAGTLGAVDYEVLTATGAGALQAWLASHGYAVPEDLAERAEPYVTNGWAFLATRLRNETGETEPLPAFRFLLCGDGALPLTYPMRLTTLSMGEALDFVLLVAGPAWFPYAGYGSRGNVEPVSGFLDDQDLDTNEVDYGQALEAHLHDAGASSPNAVFVRQFAKVLTSFDVYKRASVGDEGDDALAAGQTWSSALRRIVDEGLWVTRWRGRATRAAMEVDVVLEPKVPGLYEDDGVIRLERAIYLDENGDVTEPLGAAGHRDRSRPAGSIALLLGATLLGLAARRRAGF